MYRKRSRLYDLFLKVTLKRTDSLAIQGEEKAAKGLPNNDLIFRYAKK